MANETFEASLKAKEKAEFQNISYRQTILESATARPHTLDGR